MPRPKKNTPEGKLAAERWQKTMLEKYGNLSERMRKVGREGGLKGRGKDYKGGFAANRELASRAGAKGGAKSVRTTVNQRILEANREMILNNPENKTYKQMAQDLGVPYDTILYFVRKK